MQHYQTPCLRQTWFSRSDSFLQDVMPRKTPLQQLWIVLSCVCVYQDVWKLLSSLKPTWVKFCSSFLRDSMADFWSDCARITAKMRTTAYWTNRVEHSMSKPETPVWRSTFKKSVWVCSEHSQNQVQRLSYQQWNQPCQQDDPSRASQDDESVVSKRMKNDCVTIPR